MKSFVWLIPVVVLSLITAIVSCGSDPGYYSNDYRGSRSVSRNDPGFGGTAMKPQSLLREVNLKRDLIPWGQHARKYRRHMKPRYLTIHSTQNYSRTADAWQHSKALKNGKLRAYKRKGGNRIGYLVWHYTIDQSRVVQHLPDNEQGEHADFDGPGNNYSLGLEMCENYGNSRAATLERTAKLAAYLMHKHSIPLDNVKAHYHWPRYGLSKPNKNCPHFLMTNGRPGAKWHAFKAKINNYYQMISKPVRMPTAAPKIQSQPAPAVVPQPHPVPYYGPELQPYPVPQSVPQPAPSYQSYPQQRPQYPQPYSSPPIAPSGSSSGSSPYGVPRLNY